MKRNYQRELEQLLENISKQGQVPTLLLHSCCAPCSSYVLEYLSEYFFITVFYYNPNIYPDEEYYKRVEEQKNFIERFPAKHKISFVEGKYDKDRFYARSKGLEQMAEGGERCFSCYELRLGEAAEYAKRLGMDYFTTTLSISPMKNAEKLNEIGGKLAQEYDVQYLFSDFKKKNGYKRSVEISGEYGMYRQDYCGCVFSMQERERQKQEYRVLQIIEQDFGCEGIPDGQRPMDTVRLENTKTKEQLCIKAADELLYKKEIEEGTVITGKVLEQIQQSE